MTKKPHQSQDKYVLRLPDGMRDRLKEAAEANNRTLNSEIVIRLLESMKTWPKIILPYSVLDHMQTLSVEERTRIERELSTDVLNIVEKRYMPAINPELTDLRNAFDSLMQSYTDDEQRVFRSEFRSLIERMSEPVPVGPQDVEEEHPTDPEDDGLPF